MSSHDCRRYGDGRRHARHLFRQCNVQGSIAKIKNQIFKNSDFSRKFIKKLLLPGQMEIGRHAGRFRQIIQRQL